MQIQRVNNQQSFKANVKVKDISVLGENACNAILKALPELRKIGDDKTDIIISSKTTPMFNIPMLKIKVSQTMELLQKNIFGKTKSRTLKASSNSESHISQHTDYWPIHIREKVYGVYNDVIEQFNMAKIMNDIILETGDLPKEKVKKTGLSNIFKSHITNDCGS